MVQDIGSCITGNVQYLQYADDLKMYCEINDEKDKSDRKFRKISVTTVNGVISPAAKPMITFSVSRGLKTNKRKKIMKKSIRNI